MARFSPFVHLTTIAGSTLLMISLHTPSESKLTPVADQETAAISVRMVILDYAGIYLLHGIQAVTNPTVRRRGPFLKLSC